MSTLATSGRVAVPSSKRTSNFALKVAALGAILALALAFVLKYVFRYYLNYNQPAYTDPALGAANYWADRAWLLMHRPVAWWLC